MILLRPDKLTKTVYKTVDFNILQNICNIIFETICNNKRNYSIYIKAVHGDECQYSINRGRVTLRIVTNLKNDNTFIKYFLHEFRHFLQDKAFHVAFNDTTYNETDYQSYINSPLEIDVKNFLNEHMSHFCKLYGNMKIYKNKLITSKTGKTFTGFTPIEAPSV